MKLTDQQEELIKARVLAHDFKIESLAEDLIDHIYCYLYEHGKEDQDFDSQLERAVHLLAPDGLNSIEDETFYLLNFKRMILMKRLIFVIGLLSTMAFCCGVIFKLFHWPGANVLLGTGTLSTLLIYIPLWTMDRFKYRMVHKSIDRWKLIIGMSAGIMMGLGTTMKALHLMGADIVFISGAFVFTLGFLPLFFLSSYRNSIKAKA